MSDKQYTIHDDTVYEVSSNALYTTYTKCKVPVAKSVTPEWKGQAIPYKMWQDITDWCVLSYEKFKSETLVFLYYDLNKKDDENRWSFWIPPQITNGMTVKSDPESKFFEKERKNFPDTMFGTVHHHCSSSAFQSGTDHADELGREGLHFTIGHLNKPFDLDVHVRLTIGKAHGDVEASSVIQADPKLQKCFESLQSSYQINTIKQTFDTLHDLSICSASKDYTKREKHFSKHYAKVEKPVTTSYKSTHLGLGYGASHTGYTRNSYQNQMEFDHESGWYKNKKNVKDPLEDDYHFSYQDIAETAVDELFTEPDLLALQSDYLGTTDAANLSRPDNIKKYVQMLEDEVYLGTKEGLEFTELLDNYFDESFSNYAIEIEQIIKALKEIAEIEADIAPSTFI